VSSKHHCLLMASVLALLGQPHAAKSAQPTSSLSQSTSPSPGTNSVSGLEVKPAEGGRWLVDFDYFYTGEPQGAVFHIDLTLESGTGTTEFHGPKLAALPQPGAHHVRTSYQFSSEGTSRQFIVTITTAAWPDPQVLASERIDRVITWPTLDERDFDIAQNLIDNGSEEAIRRARPILERLISKNPKFDPGFVELARIAMKTNWGPEGLHQAETLLNSALEIRPDSVNAKILLGYVYAHQHRFREAEALFVEAARSDPPNVWLWVNWGELLEMQGNTDRAIVEYREALTRHAALKNFRARESAYDHLLSLLEARKDSDGMEALYKQRIDEFGPSSCAGADYARFKLNVRGDAQGAIDLARGALNPYCEDAPSREILGLASYVQWAQGSGTTSAAALNQARIYLPAGPMALYLLASNDNTMSAVGKLIAAGEAIDQKDNEQMTALAYALQRAKLDAAARLLRLGARPETPVGMEEMPAALLPVMDGNVDAIRVLQRAGVDYSNLHYRGATAIDFARQSGNDAMLKALTVKDHTL
jgi:tetratricopeptide (TPR) repeat protein